jgi:hypothetical protein
MPLSIHSAVFAMLLSSSSMTTDDSSPEAYAASLRRPPKEFAEWIVRVAGQDALACGHNSTREEKASSLACARKAVSSKAPFWISYQILEADYSGWSGITRNASGNTWLVTYDHGETMHGRERPRSITIVTCHKLALGNGTLQCVDASHDE